MNNFSFSFFLIILFPGFSMGQVFSLGHATSQVYFAGYQAAGGGTRFHISLQVHKPSKRIKVDSLLIKGKTFTPKILVKDRKSQKWAEASSSPVFQRGDSLVIKINESWKGELLPNDSPPGDRPAGNHRRDTKDFDGPGKIYFTNGKKKEVFDIPKFEPLSKLYYP